MSEYQRYQLIKELSRLNRSRERVFSYSVAAFLEVSERTARLWLQRLEGEQIVARPHGKRSGWVIVTE